VTLTACLGALVGILMGLTGAGGGILGVPVLVFGMGWSMQQAAPVALVAMALAATIGTIEGLRHGLVRYRAAALIALAGVLTAPLGVAAAQVIAQRWLLGAFAAILLGVALRLFGQSAADSRADAENPGAWARLDPATGRLDWTRATAFVMAAIGAATGLLTGALGVGGGFLIVPLLRRYSDISMHGVVATSLMVIALVSTGSVGAALWHGATLPPLPTALFAGATCAGMVAGRLLCRRIDRRQVQRAFAALLLAVAAAMLARAAVV
jgi:uncharacterized membrane protein YfcA